MPRAARTTDAHDSPGGEIALAARDCMRRKTMLRLERPERQHMERVRQRSEWSAAPLVVKPAQPAMTLRIVAEVNADAALPFGDGLTATRAELSMRATAARRHGIESQVFPQKRIALSSGCHFDFPRPIHVSRHPSTCGGKTKHTGRTWLSGHDGTFASHKFCWNRRPG